MIRTLAIVLSLCMAVTLPGCATLGGPAGVIAEQADTPAETMAIAELSFQTSLDALMVLADSGNISPDQAGDLIEVLDTAEAALATARTVYALGQDPGESLLNFNTAITALTLLIAATEEPGS